MAEQLISLHKVVDSALRHPMLQDVSWEAAVDYAVDFMRIVGVPSMFENKLVTLSLKDYRAKLPKDFIEIIQVRMNNRIARSSTDIFYLSNSKSNNNSDFTYKIQGSVLYTSFKEGDIEVAYKSIATDREGYPMVPDNSSFTRALELYIKKQWFTILFDKGKITTPVLQQTLQDYSWAVGDCQTEFNRLNLDSAESLMNEWRSLLISYKHHDTGFKYLGNKKL